MRHILGLLVTVAVVVAVAWWIGHLAGALSLSLGSLSIQAPLSVAFIALILLILAAYVLARLIATIFGLPGAFRRRGDHSRRRRGEDAVTSTLVALAGREPGDAQKEAARARRLLGDTPQTLLLSAYAGNLAGDEMAAEAAFEKLAERRDSAFLGLRGLLRQAVAREDWDRAAELAKQAEAANPGAVWLRAERTQLAIRTGNWADALKLTREPAPLAALGAAAAEANDNPVEARRLAKQAWKRNPKLASAAIAYARRLRQAGRPKTAQQVLRDTWAAAPHPDLAAFALEPSPDRLAQLKVGTDLVRGAEAHPESQFLLARLSLAAGLPGEAQRHAVAAQSAGLNQRRLHLLMAEIAEADGSDEVHRTRLNEALRQAAVADPDPAWRCEACGAVQDAWHAACPVCHTAGSLHWTIATTMPAVSLSIPRS